MTLHRSEHLGGRAAFYTDLQSAVAPATRQLEQLLLGAVSIVQPDGSLQARRELDSIHSGNERHTAQTSYTLTQESYQTGPDAQIVLGAFTVTKSRRTNTRPIGSAHGFSNGRADNTAAYLKIEYARALPRRAAAVAGPLATRVVIRRSWWNNDTPRSARHPFAPTQHEIYDFNLNDLTLTAADTKIRTRTASYAYDAASDVFLRRRGSKRWPDNMELPVVRDRLQRGFGILPSIKR